MTKLGLCIQLRSIRADAAKTTTWLREDQDQTKTWLTLLISSSFILFCCSDIHLLKEVGICVALYAFVSFIRCRNGIIDLSEIVNDTSEKFGNMMFCEQSGLNLKERGK